MLKPLQPTPVILPTRDLVQDYLPSDSLFFFYKGGVKGVICDAISMCNNLVPHEDLLGGIMGSVVAEYDQFEMNCVDAGIALPETTCENLETIELVVDAIEEDVYLFLTNFFQDQKFQIMRPVDYVIHDLMVYARGF